jgi:cytochrome P450
VFATFIGHASYRQGRVAGKFQRVRNAVTDLRTPPGPRAKFPGQLIFALRGDSLGFLTRTAQAYGDVAHFRIGRLKYYLLSHPDHVRDLLVTHDAKFTKGPALRAAKVTLGDGLLTSEGEAHRRQRRLAQPAFHPNRISSYADVMVRYAREQAGGWRDGGVIDVHEEMMRITLRVVAKTLFDADVASEVDEIGRAMDVSVKMFTRAMSPFGPILNRLPLPANFRFYRAYDRLLKTIDRFIAERRASGVDRGDLLSMLLRATDPESGGAGMDDKHLRDECMTLFTAGHETTANALTFAWHLLAHHPEQQQRLHAEVDAALGARPATREDVERLPFTRQVVAESMRLYPPAWAIGRQAKEPVEIGGFVLPQGAVVLICPWVVHRDARWWPDPERFDPDRWDDNVASAAGSQRPRWSYFPFGGGSRSCIGEAFAWMEAVLVTATVAQQWRVEPASSRHPRLRPTITLRPDGPLKMRVCRRQAATSLYS